MMEIKKKTHRHMEDDEQSALFDWASYAVARHKELRWLYHIPNGGKRNAAEGARLKKQGVKAGAPDICLPVARGSYHGLYIELKAGKNKPTPKQVEWLEGLTEQSYKAIVCVGWESARTAILDYLEG